MYIYRKCCKFIWLRHVVLQNSLLQQQLFTYTCTNGLQCWNLKNKITECWACCAGQEKWHPKASAVTKWPQRRKTKKKEPNWISTLIRRQASFHQGEVDASTVMLFRVQVGREISRWATRPLCRRHMPLGLESQCLARLTSRLPSEMFIDSKIKMWFKWIQHTGMVVVHQESLPLHLSELFFSSKFLGHDQNRSLKSCCSWWAQTFLISSLSSAIALGFLVNFCLIGALQQGTGRLKAFASSCLLHPYSSQSQAVEWARWFWAVMSNAFIFSIYFDVT